MQTRATTSVRLLVFGLSLTVTACGDLKQATAPVATHSPRAAQLSASTLPAPTKTVQFANRSWTATPSSEKNSSFPVSSPLYTESWDPALVTANNQSATLSLVRTGNAYTGAQMVSNESWGYGTYMVGITSPTNTLDPSNVIGIFMADDKFELDPLEIGQWGYPTGTPVSMAVWQFSPAKAKNFGPSFAYPLLNNSLTVGFRRCPTSFRVVVAPGQVPATQLFIAPIQGKIDATYTASASHLPQNNLPVRFNIWRHDNLLGGKFGTENTVTFGTFTPPAPAPPPTMTFTTGTGQTAKAGNTLQTKVTVHLTDECGMNMAGVLVAFSPSAKGAASPANVVTDELGNATTSWRLDATKGKQTLTGNATSTSGIKLSTIAGATAN